MMITTMIIEVHQAFFWDWNDKGAWITAEGDWCFRFRSIIVSPRLS